MALLYQVLIIILIGLHFNFEETKAESESGCRTYCHKDCEQYRPGPEFSTCVLANVDCSCGLLRSPRSTASIILPVSGVAICFIVLGCVLIFCSIMKMCNSSPTFSGPIQPNIGVGRDFSQPVTSHYPNASAVSVVPVSTPSYNPGFTNSNFIGSNEGPPSYSEVVRENSDTNELNSPGWNFERK